MPAQTPLGIRHNNYLNVKNAPGDPWKGSTGSDDKGHAIFETPEWGLRAAIITMRTYWFTHNRRTVARIISRWAPPNDTIGSQDGGKPNPTATYIQFVAKQVGVDPDENLELFNDDRSVRSAARLKSLIEAMARFEVGASFDVPDDEFERALELV